MLALLHASYIRIRLSVNLRGIFVFESNHSSFLGAHVGVTRAAESKYVFGDHVLASKSQKLLVVNVVRVES